jgi:hypothetical protein
MMRDSQKVFRSITTQSNYKASTTVILSMITHPLEGAVEGFVLTTYKMSVLAETAAQKLPG